MIQIDTIFDHAARDSRCQTSNGPPSYFQFAHVQQAKDFSSETHVQQENWLIYSLYAYMRCPSSLDIVEALG